MVARTEMRNDARQSRVSDVQHRGRRNHLAGKAAEDAVERAYLREGAVPVARRWRGRAGEIDLILEEGNGTLVFVEVKASRDFDMALALISAQQISRIHRAAGEYAGAAYPLRLTEMRFDAGLVNGQGRVRIIKNALLGY